MEVISNANHFYLFLAIFCAGLSHSSRGLRWKILLKAQNVEVPNKSLVLGTFFGYFINVIIPRGGEVARCTSVSLKDTVPLDKLISSVVIERALDFILLIACIGLVLLLGYDNFSPYFIDAYDKISITLSNNIFGLILFFTIPLMLLLLLYLFRNKLSQFGPFVKIVGFIKNIIIGLKSIAKLDQPLLFIGHTLFIWIMYFFMSYLPFFAIEELKGLSMIDGLFVFILGGIGMTIPSQGGAGSYHYVVGNGMSEVLKVPAHIAESFALLSHSYQTLFVVFMGVIAYFYFASGKKKSASES